MDAGRSERHNHDGECTNMVADDHNIARASLICVDGMPLCEYDDCSMIYVQSAAASWCYYEASS